MKIKQKKMQPVTLRELYKMAKSRAPKKAWNWMNNGTERELTLGQNMESFKKYKMNSRVLRDVSKINTQVNFLGVKLNFPLIISPVGYSTQFHKYGELELARGAYLQNTFLTLSPVSSIRIDDIIKKVPKSNIIYQFYALNPRKWVVNEIKKVTKLKVKAICVGTDVPVKSVKYQTREDRYDARKHGKKTNPGPPLQKMSSLNWNDIIWLRKITKLPIIIKGIMNTEDAKKSFRCGANAIWVSNHGGRSLDSGIASIDVLKEIRKAVRNKIIIFDGGIRTGSDILKAISLGANIVSIGRPSLCGLIVNGSKGVNKTFELFKEEFISTMGLCGCKSINEINYKIIKNN